MLFDADVETVSQGLLILDSLFVSDQDLYDYLGCPRDCISYQDLYQYICLKNPAHALYISFWMLQKCISIDAQWAKQLTALDLSMHNLKTIPFELQRINNLRTLLLWGNHLTLLPNDLCTNTTLEKIDVCDNRLTRLPEHMSKLENLKELHLRKNPLQELPPSVQALNVDAKQWGDFQEQICDMRALKYLCLSQNSLTKIPNTIRKLTNLEELNLRENLLTQIPDISSARKLRVLNLCNNNLSTLPKYLGTLPNLQYLNLYNNSLRTLPDDVMCHKTLTINLAYNNFDESDILRIKNRFGNRVSFGIMTEQP